MRRSETANAAPAEPVDADLARLLAEDRVARENRLLPGSAALVKPPAVTTFPERREPIGPVWTVGLVKARLSEAAYVIERTSGGAGPGSGAAFWPDYGDEGRASRPRFQASPAMMRRAEQAIRWPGLYLAGTPQIKIVQLWLYAEAVGLPWARALRKIGEAQRTADRARRTGFEIIMEGLERDRIEPA